ncbi:hypothetical protein [Tepidanaerobacter acetatoxydans]|uniref:hypothetical protein n=1 Tax=Tepidanaerobacter acetatoxydans TaxID=499229 RepID=UPI00130E0241|nr:hypothetical protein [Tepidanaerobacter acetatoxydans]
MSIDPLYLWQHVLKILSNELNNDMSFNTVLKPTNLFIRKIFLMNSAFSYHDYNL